MNFKSTGQRGLTDAICNAVEQFLAAKIADPKVKTKPYLVKASAFNKRLTKVAVAAGYEGVSQMMKDVTAPSMQGCSESAKIIGTRTKFNHPENNRKTSATAKPLEFSAPEVVEVEQADGKPRYKWVRSDHYDSVVQELDEYRKRFGSN